MSKRNRIVERASDVNGGQYIQTNPSYNSGYEDGKKAGKEYCASEIEALREQVEKLTAALKLSREALGEVQDLIGESHGVYGLHLNGDESPWNELEQGGKFERLTSLNEALAAIDSLQKGE